MLRWLCDSAVNRHFGVAAMQKGKLEWGEASPASQAQHKNQCSSSVKLRCVRPVTVTELRAAYSALDLDMPEHVASAAQRLPHTQQPESEGHLVDSTRSESSQLELSHMHGANQSKEGLHTSVTAGAQTGSAAPAYATQMDGPNHVFDPSATARAAAAAAAVAAEQDQETAAVIGHHGDHSADAAVEVGSAKRGEPDSECAVDAVLTKKAKKGTVNTLHPLQAGLYTYVKCERWVWAFMLRRCRLIINMHASHGLLHELEAGHAGELI